MILKSIFIFYFLLFIPPITYFFLKDSFNINSNIFLLILLVWIFVYRQILCGIRLVQLGKIDKKKFYKNFIPFWNDKYFKLLFFGIE